MIKLIHYRNLYKEKLTQHSPHRWHQLCKRINYLLQYQNYNKQDEITDERKLGLWEEVTVLLIYIQLNKFLALIYITLPPIIKNFISLPFYKK